MLYRYREIYNEEQKERANSNHFACVSCISISEKIEQHDSTLYCSILYTVINAHKLDIGPKGDPSTYLVSGIKVFVLEITIYDNTESLINNSDGETE